MKMNLTACSGWCWACFFSWALMAIPELKNTNLETLFFFFEKGNWCGTGVGVQGNWETKILILVALDHPFNHVS